MPHRFSPRPNKAHLIRWKDWEEDTFRKAQQVDKPVYLSLSAVWCHWCHVFDETTLSDPQVMEILNRDFVCVRVDADRNPHIQSRYLAGGWPTSAFLTPTGDTILSGTYIHPEGFKDLARKVSGYYKAHKGELYAKAARFKLEKRLEAERQRPLKGALTEEIPQKVVALVKASFDPAHGGFGREPKFPQPEALELLINEYCISNEKELLDILTKSLDVMMQGELWDKVEKGFFRYSTKVDWSNPHYEKMLEVNAALLKDYLLAYRATGRDHYRTLAEGIISYIDAHLSSPQGAFYGSQDADEEYFKLDAQGRARLQAPKVDRCFYTDWNGLIISQYLLAYQTLGNTSYLEKATRAVAFLINNGYKQAQGMCHYIEDGSVKLAGLLVDQVYMAGALLDAYEATTDRKYLELCQDIMDYVIRKLDDKRWGGFFDVPEETSPSGYLCFREKPIQENSVSARVLNRLFYITRREDYQRESERALRAFLGVYDRYSLQAAPYALAVREFITHPVQIIVVGPKEDAATQALHSKAIKTFLPWKTVQVLDPKESAPGGLKIGSIIYVPMEVPVAYVCKEGVCSIPLRSPEELEEFCKEKTG